MFLCCFSASVHQPNGRDFVSVYVNNINDLSLFLAESLQEISKKELQDNW